LDTRKSRDITVQFPVILGRSGRNVSIWLMLDTDGGATLPNEPNILSLILTLFGGGFLGVLVTQLFVRAKTHAEANKLEAEADKTKAETAKILLELNPKTPTIAEGSRDWIKGWLKSGAAPNDYEIGVDKNEKYHGTIAYIKARESPRGFGTLMQTFKANAYVGKRLKMSGNAKSEGVQDWAGLWMRVDRSNKTSSLDNMQDRPIRGATGWTKYQIVLDVPDDSINIAFGVLLGGLGQIWVSDIQFEVVSTSVPTTDLFGNYPDKPVNLNFEE
ncbi:MAG: hypothetical protein WCC64_13015, partial [Aliidongia sp.]